MKCCVLFLSVLVTKVLPAVVTDATPFNYTADYWADVADYTKIVGNRYSSFNLESFVTGYGFHLEAHTVLTDEGYNLTLHRIPHGRHDSTPKQRPVVLFIHGILSTSAEFLTIGPERSLAMQLADLDYDVWLGNNRGNTYSRDNVKRDPDDDEKFWDFSFHELGTQDLPIIIDHILNATGNSNLTYVGYCQGNTQLFALLATKPEYNEKINLFNALAPVAYMEHIPNPLVRLAVQNLEPIKQLLGKTEILGHSEIISFVLNILCSPKWKVEICPLIIYILVGFDSIELDKNYLPTFFETFPGGTSVKSLVHYMQEIKSGNFSQYDYGVMGNMKKYNSRVPPAYDLSEITAPVALFYGENDWLSATQDVDRLADELPNLVLKKKISHKFFNHLDFLLAKDLNKLLNVDVIDLINEHNGIETTSTVSPTFSESTTEATTPQGGSGTVKAISTTCILLVIFISLRNVFKIHI